MTTQKKFACDNIVAWGLLFAVLCILWPAQILVGGVEKMTIAQARQRIPERDIPRFWVGDVASLPVRLARLTEGRARTIAISPGGRPVHLIGYGEVEKLESRANFNSAVGGQELAAYMDKAARTRPVILFVGPVHGAEVEALTGLVNLVSIMETGRDLRGRTHPELQALGKQCRLLIIPAGNPDGIARFEPRSLYGMTLDDLKFWGQGTWSDDTFCDWPQSKRQHPMVGDNTGFLGCYFNDAGINPMHDEFFAPMGPEAPAILKVARAEGPDLAVSLHSHGSKPAVLRTARGTGPVARELVQRQARGRQEAQCIQSDQRDVSRQRRNILYLRMSTRTHRRL